MSGIDEQKIGICFLCEKPILKRERWHETLVGSKYHLACIGWMRMIEKKEECPGCGTGSYNFTYCPCCNAYFCNDCGHVIQKGKCK